MGKTATWKPRNEKQYNLLSSFGINYDHPDEEWKIKFGTQLIALDNQPDPSPDGRYYPTTKRVINHLGLLEDFYNDRDFFASLESRPHIWKALETVTLLRLERQILTPLRHQLEKRWLFSFYRLGQVARFETNIHTGLVTPCFITEPMLKVIPLSTEVAMVRGVKESRLRDLAPEAISVLIKKKIAYRTIFSEQQLLNYIDGWLNYWEDSKKTRDALYQLFRKKTPTAVGKKVTQLFLPTMKPKE